MRPFLHRWIGIVLACFLSLQPVEGFSQQQTPAAPSQTAAQPQTAAPSQAAAQPTATRIINNTTVLNEFQRLQQQNAAIQLLDSKLRNLGYSPATTSEHFWGQSSTYESVVNGSAETLIGTVYIQDYLNANSKDGVALGEVSLVSTSGATQTYSFYLVAPNGDPTKAQEYTVTNNEITLAHSWWTCVQGQLPTAGSACAAAVVTCAAPSLILGTFSWAAYLVCVGVSCGVAAVKACLCCACNGGFPCELFTGNCSQNSPPPTGTGPATGPTLHSGTCSTGQRCCETLKGKCTKCIGAKEECP